MEALSVINQINDTVGVAAVVTSVSMAEGGEYVYFGMAYMVVINEFVGVGWASNGKSRQT